MKKIIIPLLAGTVGLGAPHVQSQTTDDVAKNFSEQTKTQNTDIQITTPHLNIQQQEIVKKAIQGYLDFFACKKNKIIIMEKAIDEYPGSQGTTLAYAKCDTIFLHPDNIQDIDNQTLENTILHELFHALKPNDFLVTDPYILQDSAKVIGYNGLSINVIKEKDSIIFGLFEEAASIACAFAYKQNYTVQNRGYANIGSLMIKIIKAGWIKPEDLITYQQTNNLEGLLSKMLGKPISKQQIEELMKIFNTTYISNQNYANQAIIEIDKLRTF